MTLTLTLITENKVSAIVIQSPLPARLSTSQQVSTRGHLVLHHWGSSSSSPALIFLWVLHLVLSVQQVLKVTSTAMLSDYFKHFSDGKLLFINKSNKKRSRFLLYLFPFLYSSFPGEATSDSLSCFIMWLFKAELVFDNISPSSLQNKKRDTDQDCRNFLLGLLRF